MQIQISWLFQKPTDLNLHSLQRQGIFAGLRLNPKSIKQVFVADDILNVFFVVLFVILTWQMIHIKCQDLFSLKNKNKIKIVVCCSCDWHFKVNLAARNMVFFKTGGLN